MTENIRDFPEPVLDPNGIEAQRADESVVHAIELAPVAVERHLRKVFPKLGIRSRRELRPALQAIRCAHTPA